MDINRVKGWLNQQKTTVQESITRFKNKTFLDAVVAGCALVASADGKIDASEKQKMAGFIQRSEELKVFDMQEVILRFNQITSSFDFDFIIGKATALQIVGKLKHNQEAARLLVRVCCAVGLADGNFGADEKAVIIEICHELNLNPQEFDLPTEIHRSDNLSDHPPRRESPIPPPQPVDIPQRSESPKPPPTIDISPPPRPTIVPDSVGQLVIQTRRVELSKAKPSGLTLAQKGKEAYIPLKNLTISLNWATTVQLELAAIYESKNGQRSWLHSSNIGNIYTFPFMQLNISANNEKTLQINQLNDIQFIQLWCWDNTVIKNKQMLKFKDSGIYLNLMDETKKSTLIEVDTEETGNVCHLAMIDNRSIMGAKLINISQIKTLQEVTLENLI
jgi:tellurite resistance protein TerB